MTVASSHAGAPLLEVSRLGRSFGWRRAVDDVSFTLGAGECMAVFGPNGAGKTTLLRVLAGLLKPSAGRAQMNGAPLPGDKQSRAQIGLVSHQTMLYDALSARENVEFAARLYGVRDPARSEAALDRMAMLDRADTPVRSLSRGMQQRVSIARALVHAPKLILADEPYNGLDDSGSRSLTSLLLELRSLGTALIVVTHNLSEGLALATTAAIMKAGKVVRVDASPARDPAAYGEIYRRAVTAGG